MSEQTHQKPLPVVDYLKLPEDGEPYLEGHQCKECKSIFMGPRSTCSKCGARDAMDLIKLSNKGKVYVYSIIHRSFPGIDVPYISVIVDLDGGGCVKGNLINVDPDPEELEFDMPVEIIYKDALGRKDKEGNSYISFFFQPAK